MNSTLILLSMKYLGSIPLFGFSMIYGILGFSEALHFSTKKMTKWKVGALFTLFYLSIFAFFKVNSISSELFNLVYELVSSVFLGFLWTWIFIQLAKAVGHRLHKPRTWYLRGLFTVVSFGLFILIRR